MPSANTTIIGIDCAVNPKNVGLAVGILGDTEPKLQKVLSAPYNRRLSENIKDLLPFNDQTILALDAPLGWPALIGESLRNHLAGENINAADNHQLFRRMTDRFIKEKIGKQSLDVGADRIARTAHAALILLQELREITQYPIKLAWKPKLKEPVSAIEVYPSATLKVYGLTNSGYKSTEKKSVRMKIVSGLKQHMDFSCSTDNIIENPDVLDAVICVLAGADFLNDSAMPPIDLPLARKEGWIWVRNPN